MKTRRRARRVVLETLYEYDLAGHPPFEVLMQRLEATTLESIGVEFAQQLVTGVVEYQPEMDVLIARYAPEWPLEQMAVIDRNILRIAMYEFMIAGLTPVKVAINEAVELAKTYGSDSAPRFVNGVLGTLAEKTPSLREEMLTHSEERRQRLPA